ncbi:MAG: hypothetical protein AAFQ47_05295 [Pseudomonadota bacterium]
MKRAYIPILFAVLMTAGLVQWTPVAPTPARLDAPVPVTSAPLDDDMLVEVRLRF